MRAALAACLVLLLGVSAATAAPRPAGAKAAAPLPKFAYGTPFMTVRARLIRMGYDPVPVKPKPGFYYSGCLASDDFCRAFPETFHCSQGLRMCAHLFRRRADRRLVVVQSLGEENGSQHPVDLTVVIYSFTRWVEPDDFYDVMIIASPSRKGPG